MKENQSIHYKGLPLKVALKDVDKKQGIITGYAAAFNNVDSDNDIIRPGAFKRTIEEQGPEGKNRVAMLYQHYRDHILGKPQVLKEDSKGLYFETKVLETSWGRDALVLYEGGAINEHSIGYDIIKVQREQDKPNVLLELKLWEFSAVTWGANEETPFLGMKSKEDIQRAVEQIDNLHRVLRNELRDETAFDIELRIKQLKQAIMDYQDSLQSPAKGEQEAANKVFVEALKNHLKQ